MKKYNFPVDHKIIKAAENIHENEITFHNHHTRAVFDCPVCGAENDTDGIFYIDTEIRCAACDTMLHIINV